MQHLEQKNVATRHNRIQDIPDDVHWEWWRLTMGWLRLDGGCWGFGGPPSASPIENDHSVSCVDRGFRTERRPAYRVGPLQVVCR